MKKTLQQDFDELGEAFGNLKAEILIAVKKGWWIFVGIWVACLIGLIISLIVYAE